MIGVFDSGFGGLTILRDLQAALPDYEPNPDTKVMNPELWEEYPYECLTGRRIPVERPVFVGW